MHCGVNLNVKYCAWCEKIIKMGKGGEYRKRNKFCSRKCYQNFRDKGAEALVKLREELGRVNDLRDDARVEYLELRRKLGSKRHALKVLLGL